MVLGREAILKRVDGGIASVRRFQREVLASAQIVEPHRRVHAARDPADDKFLEAAIAGDARYIITGDQDLLVLGSFEGVSIVTPAQFLELLPATESEA